MISKKRLIIPEELKTPRKAWRKNYANGCSFEDFLRLSQEPCHYCGVTCSNNWKGWRYNGLDRKDQTLTHTLDNIVPCCRECNFAKGTRSYQQFLDWLQRVKEFQSLKNEDGYTPPGIAASKALVPLGDGDSI